MLDEPCPATKENAGQDGPDEYQDEGRSPAWRLKLDDLA
jgi:hypothetical protein